MDLSPQLLLQAYAMGVFPMAESHQDEDVMWIEPKLRGVFPLDNFHISRSLARAIQKGLKTPQTKPIRVDLG